MRTASSHGFRLHADAKLARELSVHIATFTQSGDSEDSIEFTDSQLMRHVMTWVSDAVPSNEKLKIQPRSGNPLVLDRPQVSILAELFRLFSTSRKLAQNFRETMTEKTDFVWFENNTVVVVSGSNAESELDAHKIMETVGHLSTIEQLNTVTTTDDNAGFLFSAGADDRVITCVEGRDLESARQIAFENRNRDATEMSVMYVCRR